MLKAADNSLLPVLRAQCTETIPARASGSRPVVPLERSRESDKHRRSTRIHGVTSPLHSSTRSMSIRKNVSRPILKTQESHSQPTFRQFLDAKPSGIAISQRP